MALLTRLFTKLLLPEASGKWDVPSGAYALTQLVHTLRPLMRGLSRLESRAYRRQMAEVEIDRPIYVCGIARAGTTITLEMLHQHPDAGTHRYFNLPLPYIPCWGTRLVKALPLAEARAVERIHADRLEVTKESPEMVEERLWMSFFDHLHDENRSNVLDGDTQNPRFERFYGDHIRKLLIIQGRRRYIVKNNNNVTRLGYLLRIFPDARFLLIARDPVAHIASFVKQHRLFMKLCGEDPRLAKSMAIVGHFEFGPELAFINVGRSDQMARIRELWHQGREVEAWAVYWASIYGFLADSLEQNAAIAAASHVVRYEALCRSSSATIDALLEHIGFPAEPFREVKAHYVETLTEPSYYRHGFTEGEVHAIRRITDPVAFRLGLIPRSTDARHP